MPRIFDHSIEGGRGTQVMVYSNQASVPHTDLVLVTLWDNPKLPGMPELEHRRFHLPLGAVKELHRALGEHLENNGCTSSED